MGREAKWGRLFGRGKMPGERATRGKIETGVIHTIREGSVGVESSAKYEIWFKGWQTCKTWAHVSYARACICMFACIIHGIRMILTSPES